MKADQIAFYCQSDKQIAEVKKWFGLENAQWIHDVVTAQTICEQYHGKVVYELFFNYDLGIELEIIRCLEGFHWAKSDDIAMSHLGVHMDDGQDWPEGIGDMVQMTVTTDHSNPAYKTKGNPLCGRQYDYRIYQLGPGTFVKYIRRIYAAE